MLKDGIETKEVLTQELDLKQLKNGEFVYTSDGSTFVKCGEQFLQVIVERKTAVADFIKMYQKLVVSTFKSDGKIKIKKVEL